MDLTELQALLFILCNILLGVVFCAGCTANTLVLLVFYRKTGLRTIANRFVVNLMLINIIACVSLLPLALADNEHKGSTAVCLLGELFSVFCSTGIILSVLMIAVDQYFAVVDPLHYHSVISSCRSACMIVAAWGFSALVAVLAIAQPHSNSSVFQSCLEPNRTWKDAEVNELLDGPDLYRLLFSTFFLVFVFLVPFAFICFIYCRICAAASGNSKRARPGSAPAFSNDDFVIAPLTEAKELTDCYVIEDEAEERHQPSNRPSFVLTRPSPPRGEPNSSLPNLKQSEAPLLKPTLKNNASFSKLTSLHIQFSATKELQTERRHSNVAMAVLDPEFENISKNRSPSIQSSSFEVPSRTSSTRSSSVHSTLTRGQVCSRASSIRSTSSYIHNIKHRISNASLFRYREDARAARISAMVIVMALLCWLPFFILFYIRKGLSPFLIHLPLYLNSVTLLLLLISTVVSPCLFAFRNRKVKKEIRKMFGMRKKEIQGRCSKSFYTHNFSIDLKAHTAQLLLSLKHKNQQITKT